MYTTTRDGSQFSYGQVLNMAMQLTDNERMRLCRELSRVSRSDSLKRICEAFRTDDLSEEEIRQECEAVRQEMYKESLGTKNG